MWKQKTTTWMSRCAPTDVPVTWTSLKTFCVAAAENSFCAGAEVQTIPRLAEEEDRRRCFLFDNGFYIRALTRANFGWKNQKDYKASFSRCCWCLHIKRARLKHLIMQRYSGYVQLVGHTGSDPNTQVGSYSSSSQRGGRRVSGLIINLPIVLCNQTLVRGKHEAHEKMLSQPRFLFMNPLF